MADIVGGTPLLENEVFALTAPGGVPMRFFVATPEQARLPEVQQWQVQEIPAQDGEWQPEQTLALHDFANGAGFTFQGAQGTYEYASGWDASAPGVVASWPSLTTGEAFASDAVHGWVFQLGGFIYVARGRWVCKYAINDTPGATWPILEIHDLGSGNDIAGRPDNFNDKAYVPVRIGTTGTLQPFHELTAQATPTTGVQTITIAGTPTGGTYTLTWNGNTTSALVFNATQAQVQAALQALPGLWKVTVATTGTSPNYTHTVTMTAAGATLAGSAVGAITATSSLTGGSPTITPAVTTAGVGDTWNTGPSGAGTHQFRCFTAFQFKLYGAQANMIYSCATTPTTDANWSPTAGAGYQVDDPAIEITDLGIYLQYLIVAKADGIFSFDTSLNTVNEVPDLKDAVDNQNGVGLAYSNGSIYAPNRAGLVRWAPGAYALVGPNQEGGMEPAYSPGWGRAAHVAAFGKYCFVNVNDSLRNQAVLASILPPNQQRNPVLPHVHSVQTGAAEGLAVISLFTQPIAPQAMTTYADNAGIGSVTWTIPGGGPTPANPASAGPGLSHYLTSEGLTSPNIPLGATITGVFVTVTRNAGV